MTQESCALLGQVFRLLRTGEAMPAKGVGGCSYLNIKQIEALVATAVEVGKKHQLRAFDRITAIVAREAAGPLALGPLQG